MMDREHLDHLWHKAMRESIEDGEIFIRYHFAKLVRDDYSNKHAQLWLKRIDEAVEAEREAIAADADWCIQNHLEHLIPERIQARST